MKTWLNSLKYSAEPSPDECIEKLSGTFPLLLRLKDTQQDPLWHGEGNVQIHTSKVLEELYGILRKKDISGERRQALIIAALLHDIAKTFTTKESFVRGEMHITAPQHEKKGRSHISFGLKELPLSYPVIRLVLSLVGDHGMPKRAARSGREGVFLHLSRMCDIELLYLLETADMKGRICDDLEENLELMEMFRLYAEEFRCWKNDPYSLWNAEIIKKSAYSGSLLDITIAQAKRDREAGTIYTPDEAISRSYRFRDGFPELILLCGLSGSGKSTFISGKLEGYRVISLDSIRKELFGKEDIQRNFGKVIQCAKERLKNSLRKNEKVLWDATSLRVDFRSMIIDLTRSYGGLTTLVFIHTTVKEAETGNKNRDRQVPQAVLEKQINTFEFPVHDEADRTVIADFTGKVLWKYGFYGQEEW